jgi:hypothetical protein
MRAYSLHAQVKGHLELELPLISEDSYNRHLSTKAGICEQGPNGLAHTAAQTHAPSLCVIGSAKP